MNSKPVNEELAALFETLGMLGELPENWTHTETRPSSSERYLHGPSGHHILPYLTNPADPGTKRWVSSMRCHESFSSPYRAMAFVESSWVPAENNVLGLGRWERIGRMTSAIQRAERDGNAKRVTMLTTRREKLIAKAAMAKGAALRGATGRVAR